MRTKHIHFVWLTMKISLSALIKHILIFSLISFFYVFGVKRHELMKANRNFPTNPCNYWYWHAENSMEKFQFTYIAENFPYIYAKIINFSPSQHHRVIVFWLKRKAIFNYFLIVTSLALSTTQFTYVIS